MQGDHLDRAGTATSIACAIHCAVTPLILPLLPLAGRHLVGPWLEATFALLALALGVISLGHSYRVVHRDRRALGLFVAGFTTLMAVRWFDPPAVVEAAGIFVAASLIVGSHAFNLRLRRFARRDGACDCACHDP